MIVIKNGPRPHSDEISGPESEKQGRDPLDGGKPFQDIFEVDFHSWQNSKRVLEGQRGGMVIKTVINLGLLRGCRCGIWRDFFRFVLRNIKTIMFPEVERFERCGFVV